MPNGSRCCSVISHDAKECGEDVFSGTGEWVPSHVCVYVCVCVYGCLYVCAPACVCVCVCACVCACACVCVSVSEGAARRGACVPLEAGAAGRLVVPARGSAPSVGQPSLLRRDQHSQRLP